jgi:hypothetical protein
MGIAQYSVEYGTTKINISVTAGVWVRCLTFTANVGTEGAVKFFLFWDISEEFPITR